MPSILENPFTPKSAIPVKRLFEGEERIVKRKLGKQAQEKIKQTKEQFEKVKYGDYEILKPQAEFLYKLEKELLEKSKDWKRELSKEEAKEEVAKRIKKVDEFGNITFINICGWGLKNLPSLEKLIYLEKFWCFDNELASLPGLDKLINLKKLICYNNNLTKIPGLDKLTHLRELDCRKNKFSEQEKDKIESQVPKNCDVYMRQYNRP